MKSTTKSASGTSFHGTKIEATPNQLLKVLGNPKHIYNDGRGKSNFDWTMETETGDVVTVYDYKYYKELEMDTVYEWNIGGHGKIGTDIAANEIKQLLNSI
jgi:hypothetical protein